MNQEIIGYAAGLCTSLCFLPQVIQIIRTKKTKDISLSSYIVYTAGVIFWLIYGILDGSPSIISANCLSLLLAFTILYYKLRHG